MANETAFPGPYVDQSLTKRNPSHAVPPMGDTPAKSGSTTLGEVTIYDVPEVDHEPGDQGATEPPHSPNSWKPGRDPYKNNGMVGQDFMKNVSEQ